MSYEKDANGVLCPPPIHEWFGLSYTNYFVMPRLALQDLPHEWQRKFIALMDEAHDVHGMKTPEYHVLRKGNRYTVIVKEWDDDKCSPPSEYLVVGDDPWANYRRGNSAELLKNVEEE